VKIPPAAAELFHVDGQTDGQTDGIQKNGQTRRSQWSLLAIL